MPKSLPQIDAHAIEQGIRLLVTSILDNHSSDEDLLIVGIANGGIPLAQRIARDLSIAWKNPVDCGIVNAIFHRDDVHLAPLLKDFQLTHLPFDMDDREVILVDDVIHSGRTIRAAINELFDHGRPRRVELAVLVEREGRVLPIVPDFTAMHVDVPEEQNLRAHIDLDDPTSHHLTLHP